MSPSNNDYWVGFSSCAKGNGQDRTGPTERDMVRCGSQSGAKTETSGCSGPRPENTAKLLGSGRLASDNTVKLLFVCILSENIVNCDMFFVA